MKWIHRSGAFVPNSQMVYCNLGIVTSDCLIGLENARLTGSEVQRLSATYREGYVSSRISLTYATTILRAFREDVIAYFFTQYPDAVYINDWRILAKVVARFATHNEVSWQPSRAGCQDAIQKMRLLDTTEVGISAKYYEGTGRLVTMKSGRVIRWCIVKPYKRSELDNSPFGDTVYRIDNDLVYACELGNIAA